MRVAGCFCYGLSALAFSEFQIGLLVYQFAESNHNVSRDFSYKDQIKRAALSISNNIAEGFEYSNNNDFIRYLRIAKGSCGEVRNCLLFAVKIKYETQENLTLAIAQSKTLSSQIGNLLQYLKKRKLAQPVTRNKNNSQPKLKDDNRPK
ncbi:MAG: four helix bundle protein [Bacteroidota bacterium]